MLNILVIGSGAVGGFYGAMLGQVDDVAVSFLCRSDYDMIHQQGLQIESKIKNFQFRPHRVLRAGQPCQQKFDYILVALKVLPDIQLAEILIPYVCSQTTILLLQNGIAIEQPLVEQFPQNEILSGLAFTCINRLAAGHIKHIDYGQINIGSFNRPSPSTNAQRLQNLFSRAEVECLLSEDITRDRWRKLVWNAPFNPISVLSGAATTAEILAHPATRQQVKQVMQEVMTIANKEGYTMPTDLIENYLLMTEQMQPYKTSMLLDFENHREMEVEAILGKTIEIANRHQLPCPYLQSLYAMLSLLNEKNLSSAH